MENIEITFAHSGIDEKELQTYIDELKKENKCLDIEIDKKRIHNLNGAGLITLVVVVKEALTIGAQIAAIAMLIMKLLEKKNRCDKKIRISIPEKEIDEDKLTFEQAIHLLEQIYNSQKPA